MPYDFTIDLGKDGKIGARHYAPDRDYALGATYVMAPGASLGQDSKFLVTFGELLSERGLDVVSFNFPFLQRGSKRPDGMAVMERCYRAVMKHVAETPALAGQPLIAGGKSMGGRIASFLAARPDGFDQPLAGLIFLGYPLHAPQRPEQLRVVHLPDVKVPMLFVQGTRDPFGTPLQLDPVLSTLTTPVRIHRVMGGDHSYALPRKWAGAEPQVFDAAARAIAEWVSAEVLKRGESSSQESSAVEPSGS
jgi:predicted alpha/beta-hydrolase family hydrolase